MLFSPNAAGPAKSLVPVEIERPVMRKRAELHWHKMWVKTWAYLNKFMLPCIFYISDFNRV